MKVIVTGGAGFIGSAVTRRFLRASCAVLVYDRLTYAGNLSTLADVQAERAFSFVQGDINDQARFQQTLQQFSPHAIVHLAAESHVDRSITGPAEFIQTNVLGTFALLEASLAYWRGLPSQERDSFRFLHVSTDEVFGALGGEGAFCESTPYDPRSPYAASKASSDHLVSAWRHTYGLPTLIANCSNNFGPYQLPEKLIPTMILTALDQKALPVYGDGKNVRDWLYVEDHAAALEAMLLRAEPGSRYCIGGRSERTNLSVVEAICEGLDQRRPQGAPHRSLIRFVEDRPGHDFRYAIDGRKIEADLDWRPNTTFDAGLSQTLDWYLDNAWWWGPLRMKGVGAARLGLPKADT